MYCIIVKLLKIQLWRMKITNLAIALHISWGLLCFFPRPFFFLLFTILSPVLNMLSFIYVCIHQRVHDNNEAARPRRKSQSMNFPLKNLVSSLCVRCFSPNIMPLVYYTHDRYMTPRWQPSLTHLLLCPGILYSYKYTCRRNTHMDSAVQEVAGNMYCGYWRAH